MKKCILHLNKFIFAAIIALLSAFSTFADNKIIFGPEFTFTNHRILANLVKNKGLNVVHSPDLIPYLNRIEFLFKDYCLKNNQCTINRLTQFKLKVEFSDFEIMYATDPGVIEVTMSPMSVEEFKMHSELLQKLAFSFTKEAGLFPSQWVGSGHVSIGFDYFKNKPLLFKDFMFDYFNHNELATVIFENDLYNAPVITKLPKEKLGKLMSLAKEYEQSTGFNLDEFINRIDDEVYLESKYNALNLTTLYDDRDSARKRIEMRGHRSQKSFSEFIDTINMYEARIKYLEKNPNIKLAIKDYDSLKLKVAEVHFKKYIEEAGLSWKEYQKYVPKIKDSIVRKTKHYLLQKFNHYFNCSIDLHQPKNFDEWIQP